MSAAAVLNTSFPVSDPKMENTRELSVKIARIKNLIRQELPDIYILEQEEAACQKYVRSITATFKLVCISIAELGSNDVLQSMRQDLGQMLWLAGRDPNMLPLFVDHEFPRIAHDPKYVLLR